MRVPRVRPMQDLMIDPWAALSMGVSTGETGCCGHGLFDSVGWPESSSFDSCDSAAIWRHLLKSPSL